jgi:hypothetical protein
MGPPQARVRAHNARWTILASGRRRTSGSNLRRRVDAGRQGGRCDRTRWRIMQAEQAMNTTLNKVGKEHQQAWNSE